MSGVNNNGFEPRELGAGDADIALLEDFYRTLYCDEFPDPDEREALENMCEYLRLKATGWYGANNYHILLLLDAGRPVGGSISDYLALPNAGVIEFLLIAADYRQRGLGAKLLAWTEQLLQADAARVHPHQSFCIAAEMHDPALPDRHATAMDTQTRARIWGRWGYARLAFDYVQPALSAQQEAVRHLWLIAKCAQGDRQIEASRLIQLIHEYLVWAMRIQQPDHCVEYNEMERALRRADAVQLLPLTTHDNQNA